VASICSMLTGGDAGVEVHCHMALGHAHVQQTPRGYRMPAHPQIEYAPSATSSFASLDTCTSPVEYDVSFA
jgi:hypothetical protein